MALIDFILNVAGVLLWLNWLSVHFDPLAGSSANTLAGTLRKADPSGPRRWRWLAALGGMIFVRAWIGTVLSVDTGWSPKLDLVFTSLPFRADIFGHTLLFSTLSFVRILAGFYFGLVLLSATNREVPDADPFQHFTRVLVKWVDRWPTWVKLLLPPVAGGLLWMALHPLLSALAIVPETRSAAQLFAQAAVIGAGTYFAWKYLIVALLLLHLLNSYIYFGEHAVWKFINATSQNLLRPLRRLPLRAGKVDLLPVLGVALVFLVSELATHPGSWPSQLRQWYYELLPF